HYPKWAIDVTQEIAEDMDSAVKDDESAEEDLCVYLDGSVVDRGVGGVVVLLWNGEIERMKRFYLGSDQEHIVYKREIVGMILAIVLLKEEGGI
ncbi:hypothetical protein CY34DRAFT_75157, partial [Suillus luteus UH-Slu-Lm8-n1]